MKRARFTKTLFLRLMFTYLPMVVISILLTTILIAYATGRYMRKAMDDLYSSTIQSTADIIDQKLSSVYNTMFQLACNRMINDLRTAPEPYSLDDLYMIADIVDELSAATMIDDMIKKIYLYSPTRDYILAGRAKHGHHYFLRENYPGYDPVTIIDKIATTSQSGFFSVVDGQTAILTLVTYIPLISDQPDLYICAILNDQELHSTSVITLEDKENLVFLNRENEIVYNFKPDYAGHGAWDGSIEALVRQTNAQAYPIQSTRAGLTYVYLNQSSFVREQLMRITLTALLIGSATILAVITLVIVASKRISVPVTSLIKLFDSREREARPISDLDLIREKVSALYHDQNEMSRRMETVNTNAIEWALERIFNKSSTPAQEAITLTELHLSFPRANSGICILKIMHYIALKQKYSEVSFVELKQKLGAMLREQLAPYCEAFIVYRENRLIVAANYDLHPDQFQDILQEQLYAVQKLFWRSLHLDIHAVISDLSAVPDTTNEALFEAYLQSFIHAQKSLEQLFFEKEPVIMLAASVKIKSDNCIYQYPEESETALMNQLFSGQIQAAISTMEHITAFNREQCDYANMKQLLTELLSAPIKALLKSGSNPDEILRPRHTLFADLEACDTIDESVAYIADIFMLAGDYLSSVNMKWPMPRKDVLSYIEDHFREDLGVADIAGYFNLSPGYFSRVFRQMMNDSFLEYLTRYRIKKAEKIILEKHVSLKEIAEQVGFNSYKSFYRSFKKQTLCNPHEYKQKMLGTDQTGLD